KTPHINYCVQRGASAHTHNEKCVSSVYEKNMRKQADRYFSLLDSGTGIEPVDIRTQGRMTPTESPYWRMVK
ncbi:MAG: hypothetical protein P8M36_05835, partial [Gammaproteobacteria bacterium]|nr:hypothetical protein [Gammaproteobacteria bacterium]